MNILYLDPTGKGIYYDQFRLALESKANIYQYGPGLKNYSPYHTMENIINIYKNENNQDPDFILFGYGWEKDVYSKEGYDSNIHGSSLNLNNIKIPKGFILNKEYKNLEQKLKFLQDNNFDVAFTVHHDYLNYERQSGVEFYKLPFAANDEIFKDYGEKKKIDLGFSGNMFNYGPYRGTDIMGNYFQNIRERVYDELKKPEYNNINIWWNSNSGKFLYGTQYAKLINGSKIWMNTPSAIEIVGTRFYEVIACKTLLFSRKCDWAFDGLGFEDGKTCVFYESDLSDFGEKLFYYLKNESERESITSRAYDLFLDKHTWAKRAEFVISIAKEIRQFGDEK